MSDKAGKSHWDSTWCMTPLPKAVDPFAPGPRNHVSRKFHSFFRKTFASSETRGRRLLEVGCARSVWLPYFAREFGFDVSGIDYSEIGCRQAEQILSREGVEGQIVLADLFSPPQYMIGMFDVVVTFGVVEHFEDTASCLEALSKYLKPGGLLITVIPNLLGVAGFLQKLLNRRVYEMHVPLSDEELKNALVNTQFAVEQCAYFFAIHPGFINLSGLDSRSVGTVIKRVLQIVLTRLSMMIWCIEDRIMNFPSTAALSAYIVAVAKKKTL